MTVTREREGAPTADATRWSVGRIATVDVVVPVYNEERALPGCLRVLRSYLDDQFPFEWTITVVDNASTDEVLRVAKEIAESDDRVRVLHLDRKGRGHALRTAWEYSDADAPGARTVRSPRREVISRCYNTMIRLTHGARFSDAQCGFKAACTDVVRPLPAHVRDDGRFFDTELLLFAEHNGLRVHEVPVDWVEDLDSRVRLVSTAMGDVRGLARVARAKVTGAARVPGLPQRPEPRSAHPDAVLATHEGRLRRQLVTFGLIGLVSTAATAVLYALLRSWSPPLVANLVALVAVTC